ncbi:MAG TPA: hypothetical protein PKD85_09960 [Saprospiraceae bacterium]|nr:hypothetical protein [Saprospiraceae bacterium]
MQHGIDKENVVETVLELIKLSDESQTSKEIFLVSNNDYWQRLYWNPITQLWNVKLFPQNTEFWVGTPALLSISKDHLDKNPTRGFQYKFGNCLQIYKVL